ncbi:hypothetical protein [Bacillus atrophaeus]|nr:hypothetical protein [Bacillus atrophaeus]
MDSIKSIEEAPLLNSASNKISMKEFLNRHEPDMAEAMSELDRLEEYGE